jgi:cyclic dehypoxanthinyl futalosine synthase
MQSSSEFATSLSVASEALRVRSGQALQKAVAGHRLDREEILSLFSSELIELGIAADLVCRRFHSGPVRTFVIDRTINYSNVCVTPCKFCAFWRPVRARDAYVRSHDEIFRRVQEAVDLGATQILLQGGLHPDLPLEWYERLLSGIKQRFPVHLHSFSPPEIVHFSKLFGLSIEGVLARLRSAGLDSVAGGGAEILVDSVRRKLNAHLKATTAEWLEVMKTAHRIGMPATATMMFGHVETLEDRVEHLLVLRRAQDETGGLPEPACSLAGQGFTAFIPWTYQPENTVLGGEETGAFDYLRTLAISRLALDNFKNIQCSWLTQGPKIGQVGLRFGANDIGGTTIEENVVTAAGVRFRSMPADELAHLIRQAGFEPAQRDTYYRILRKF